METPAEGYVTIATSNISATFQTYVKDPGQVIADCESRFGITSHEFQHTDKMLQVPRTMENAFYIIMWDAALNQIAGKGWEPFGAGLVGTEIKFDGRVAKERRQ